MPPRSDREILEQFRTPGKEESAFRELVNAYQKRLYWHIRKIMVAHEDTDDVLQNTLVKAWQGMPRFRSGSSLFTWLYRIATNEALSALRQKRRHMPSRTTGMEDWMEQTLSSDPWFDGEEAQRKLQRAILRLPDKQRIVFNMKYFDELKYEEMSEILGTSVGALKASYHHAVKKIEAALEGD